MGATAIAPVFNGFPISAFAQNVGMVALTGIKSRFVVAAGGGILVVLGLLPVLGRIMNAIPQPVLGGAGIVLFGSVAAAGIRTLSRVKFTNSNVLIVAASIGVGIIPITVPEVYNHIPEWLATIFESGISATAIFAVLLNLAFNHFSKTDEPARGRALTAGRGGGRPKVAFGAADVPKATFGTSGPAEDNARMTAIDGVTPAPDGAAAGGDPTLSGHVIVYGVRGVGLRTIEHLHTAGVDTVVVHAGPDDADPVADALLASWGVPQVTGRTREALAAARLDTAAAVICVPDDDLRSMETALLVRRVRPDVRLVVRMGNSAVGRALAEAAGEDSVLDVAALAAPAVVEACRGARPRRMVLAGQTFLAADLIVDRPATLRELYGELAPIAVSRDGAATNRVSGSGHRRAARRPGDGRRHARGVRGPARRRHSARAGRAAPARRGGPLGRCGPRRRAGGVRRGPRSCARCCARSSPRPTARCGRRC